VTEPSYESTPSRSLMGYGRPAPAMRRPESANLADILERVLDKGIVIAGDIQVNLLDIELLTIKLRLVIASVDRAKEMGIDWWEHDPTLSSRASSGDTAMVEENRRLRERVAALEAGDEPRSVAGDRHADRYEDRHEDRREGHHEDRYADRYEERYDERYDDLPDDRRDRSERRGRPPPGGHGRG
jgi:hypothetical protein